MSLLTVRLFGPLRVEQDGQAVARFRSHRTMALLGYLVAARRPMARSDLAALFWPDLSRVQALGELRRSLHNLTTLLPACFEADRRMIHFQPVSTCQVDLAVVERLLANGDPASLEQAITLYRGEFLEGLHLDGCAEFETWLLIERERWRQQVVTALDRLIEHHVEQGNYERGIESATRLLELEPWREETHRRLMLLLARGGRFRAALAHYERCRQLLAEELGVEPAAETVDLYLSIESVARVPAHNLPSPPTPFVGRAREVGEIKRMVAGTYPRLLTLVGPGGIGKSRLAQQVALELADARARRFLHGVLYVPLAEIQFPDFLLSALATVLGLSFQAPAPPQAQLLDFLREKEMLLLLDNYEHLLPETTLLREVLEAAPGVKFLVTSRERLNLRQEWLFDVEEMSYPATSWVEGEAAACQVEQLLAHDAVRLFEQSARRVRPGFSLATEGADAVRVCQMVEGVPLALELAAGRLRYMSCADLAREVSADPGILATDQHDAPRRHHSVRVLFESVWRALSAEERQVLARLAVFQGGFTQDAARHVAGASLRTLASLVEKSILRAPSLGRYTPHALVRQFAMEKLRATVGEEKQAHARHAAYYARFLEARERELQGPKQRARLEEIAPEIDNIRAAWNWALEHGAWEHISASLAALHRFYESQGWYVEANELFTRALEAFEPGRAGLPPAARVARGHLLARAALLHIRLGRVPGALELAREASAVLEQEADATALAYARTILGTALMYSGEFTEAVGELRRAETVFRESGEPAELIRNLSALASAFLRAGDYEQGLDTLKEGLDLCRASGDRRGEITFLQNIATVHLWQGRQGAAEERFEECLPLCEETGFQSVRMVVLENLGEIAFKRGDFARARALCEESIAIARELADRMNLARTLSLLGVTLTEMGVPAEGWSRLREALQVARTTHSPPTILAVLDSVALWLVAAGRQEPAIDLLCYLSQHPATERQYRDHAARLLATLRVDTPLPGDSQVVPRPLDEVVASYLSLH